MMDAPSLLTRAVTHRFVLFRALCRHVQTALRTQPFVMEPPRVNRMRTPAYILTRTVKTHKKRLLVVTPSQLAKRMHSTTK